MTVKLNQHLHDTDSVEVIVCGFVFVVQMLRVIDASLKWLFPFSSLFFKDRRSFGET